MASLGDLLWIAALVGIFYYMMRGGGCCSGHSHGNHDGHGGEEHKGRGNDRQHTPQQLKSTEKKSAANPVAQDPVCSMAVKQGSTGPRSEYFGRTFHFCSERCRKLFDLNPGRYAGSA